MLRSLNALVSSVIRASDGELGQVEDFLFDDKNWAIRYFVVETGRLLRTRRVLITPSAASHPEWDRRIIAVDLTVQQVHDSPDVDTAKPVSRQQEIEMHQYYGWPAYWSMEAPMMPVFVEGQQKSQTELKSEDPHLRSWREVGTYQVEALDGDVGKLDDLIVEDPTWRIRYLVIKTGGWFSGQKLLISARWVSSIAWAERRVVLAEALDRI